MIERYEHHATLKQNKLSPFELARVYGNAEAVSNWHRNLEVILVVAGKGGVRYGARELALKEGDLVAVNAEVLHRFYGDPDFSYFYLIVDEGFCLENGISPARLRLDPLFCDENIKTLYEGVIHAFSSEKNGSPFGVTRRRAAVLTLLLALCEDHATLTPENRESAAAAEEYVKRVMRHLNDHYKERVTLDALASLCGITKFHLAREFKRYTGQTVLSYLNTLRCERASLLISEGASVTEAAFACGFESLSYFSRTYKRLLGTSPKKAK